MGKTEREETLAYNIMSQKTACLILFFGLTCIFYAQALDQYGAADYDDRLAQAEQNFWLNKIPQMYLWKLRHLSNPEQENSINEDLEVPPHRKRGGKFNGLRRYG